MGDENTSTEYAVKRVGDRYEIKNPLTGIVLSYNNPEAAETYIKARPRDRAEVSAKPD